MYVPISKLKCDLCDMRFITLDHMDDHMDTNHGGRWKYNDPDVVMLGDDNEESEDSEDSETSFESSENSEDKSSDTQSGEDLV